MRALSIAALLVVAPALARVRPSTSAHHALPELVRRALAGRGVLGAQPVQAVDGVGRAVRLAAPARRVVSVVPSATDILIALGAGARIAGRTDYDTAAAVRAAPSVGGGIDPSIERIAAARPDLVVAWPGASAARMRDAVARLGIPVFVMETRDTAALLAGMRGLARLTGRVERGETMVRTLRAELAAVRASVPPGPRPSAFYVVWTAPPTTAGPQTYVTELLGLAGLRPAFPEATGDWPQLSLEALLARQPDVLVVPRGADGASGTLARMRALDGWQALRALREGRVIEVDAAAMNRPGPGLGAAARQLRDGVRRVTGR